MGATPTNSVVITLRVMIFITRSVITALGMDLVGLRKEGRQWQ
jgi:hypothetical protein